VTQSATGGGRKSGPRKVRRITIERITSSMKSEPVRWKIILHYTVGKRCTLPIRFLNYKGALTYAANYGGEDSELPRRGEGGRGDV